MSWTEAVGLTLAAAAGGAINAVAGGGTLVTFPTLLFFGTPAIEANATSTLALVLGTGGSIFSFRRRLPAVRDWFWRLLPVSVLGSIVGAFWLTHTQEKVFSRLGPFFFLFSTFLLLGQGFVGKILPAPPWPNPFPQRHPPWWVNLLAL